MSRTLWLDHCLQLARLLSRSIPNVSSIANELHERVRVELTMAEFDQLAYELESCQLYFNAGAGPIRRCAEIRLLGVAFAPRDAEYIEKLRKDLRESSRGLPYNENSRMARNAEPAGRRALDRGLHVDPTHQPGANRRGST